MFLTDMPGLLRVSPHVRPVSYIFNLIAIPLVETAQSLTYVSNIELQEVRHVLERLPELGISIDKVTQQLEDKGVE